MDTPGRQMQPRQHCLDKRGANPRNENSLIHQATSIGETSGHGSHLDWRIANLLRNFLYYKGAILIVKKTVSIGGWYVGHP
jgi:hypothetical protein